MNMYLKDDKAYNIVKESLKHLDVEFIQSDIYQYSDWNNYDNINLSNIGQYAKNIDELYKYKKLVSNLVKHLSPNGTILISYLFGKTKNNISPLDDLSFTSPIYDLLSTIDLFSDLTVDIYKIPSIKEIFLGDKSSPDKVLIYKKPNK